MPDCGNSTHDGVVLVDLQKAFPRIQPVADLKICPPALKEKE